MALGAAAALLILPGMHTPPGDVPALVAAASPTEAFRPVTGAVFGDPTAPSNAILTALLDNIEHTPPGATIRIIGYSFSLGRVATALQDAYARGVHVQVVMNGHSRQWAPAQRLAPLLGSDVTRRSFFVLTRGSARGPRGVTHQKSWTFSQVGRTRDIVMVGSMNLTGHGTEVQYSDAYVYTERPDVYAAYVELFDVQKLDTPVPAPYRTAGFPGGGAEFFPRPGTTQQADPAALRISSLPSGADTRIRVSQFAWYGPRGTWLAEALAAQKRAGSSVVVVAGESVGSGVRRVLAEAGIPVHSGMYAHGKRIHTKLMLASYVDDTGTHTAIWTGSDNWSQQSFRNDDVVARVQDDRVAYRRYLQFFTFLAHPVAATGTPAALPAPVTVPAPPRSATRVTARMVRHRVHRHGRGVIAGTVRPEYAGRRVLVQRHRAGTPGWRTVARSAPLSGSESYRVRVPTGRTGLWRYRAVVRATVTGTSAWSATVSLRVLP
ncbi:MAG TPA: phospholipase D-like domain-containing protein [Nocardioidaceae bacterium]|nr:phospholipase D-like domain-containing protein [Nocardioidaceae bacterium]